MEALKIVLLGDSGVGKTSIINRSSFNKFNDRVPSTLGGMVVAKTVTIPEENIEVKFCLWDTAGQERYHSLAPKYYKDADIVFIVYDITNYESFKGAKTWLEEVKNNSKKDVRILLLGNKSDRFYEEKVTLETAQEFANANNINLNLVSAKDDFGITMIFESLAREFASLMKRKVVKEAGSKSGSETIHIKSNDKNPKKPCC